MSQWRRKNNYSVRLRETILQPWGRFCVLIEFISPTGKPTWSTGLHVKTKNSYLQIILMECWSKLWTLLFCRVLPELLDCWRRRGIFTTAIYIFFALYKLFVKFELKLLMKSIVLPLSLRSVAVFVLLGLNTTEANPIGQFRYFKIQV